MSTLSALLRRSVERVSTRHAESVRHECTQLPKNSGYSSSSSSRSSSSSSRSSSSKSSSSSSSSSSISSSSTSSSKLKSSGFRFGGLNAHSGAVVKFSRCAM